MLINEHTAIYTNKVLLVPYCRHHVTTYHDWMKDPDIQVATASELLSIDEEYAMQQSWRSDTDKLTFILCLAPPNGVELPKHTDEIASMIGDVNMFVSVHEEEDSKLSLIGEIELMIATKNFQRKGLGRSALLTFLSYVLQHEKAIIEQYPGRTSLPSKTESFDYFTVKINENNTRSLALFEGIGFEKTSTVPSYFGEYELRHHALKMEKLNGMLQKNGVQNYREIGYHKTDDTSDFQNGE